MPFQSSRVGGRPRGEDDAAEVRLREVEWASMGTPVVREAAGDDDDISVPTDLRALVTAITAAGDEMDVHAPPSPWLPALPERVVLADLWRGREPGDAPVAGVVPPLPIGLGDHPREQRQDPMTWDVERGGHLAFAGQPRSGRSSALRVVAGAVADAVSPRDLHLYGIDCGNNALLPLVALPHVGAVVSRDQQDRVRRLVALLGREVARRQTLLAEQGFADVAEQRRAVAADGRPDERLPYLVVLLDRWEGFVAAYEQVDSGTLVEQVTVLMREGAAVGLRFVVSGDRSLVTGRMSTLLEDRVVLRLAQAEDYSLIGMRPKDVPASMPEGRAFRAGGPTEVQVALLDDDPAGTAQVAALQALARRATAAWPATCRTRRGRRGSTSCPPRSPRPTPAASPAPRSRRASCWSASAATPSAWSRTTCSRTARASWWPARRGRAAARCCRGWSSTPWPAAGRPWCWRRGARRCATSPASAA